MIDWRVLVVRWTLVGWIERLLIIAWSLVIRVLPIRWSIGLLLIIVVVILWRILLLVMIVLLREQKVQQSSFRRTFSGGIIRIISIVSVTAENTASIRSQMQINQRFGDHISVFIGSSLE